MISDVELLPGYYRGSLGQWLTLPYPEDEVEREALKASSVGMQVINWAEGRTDEPGLTDYQTGKPWRFTAGQARFLILWYAFDERGRFVYRSGVKRGAKGTGKDPFGAAMCNIEFLGPSQLVWDEVAERFVGQRHLMPLVQIASNSEDQSKDMLRVANAMWNGDARDYYRIDPAETRTILKDSGGRMEVLTASVKTSEGDPATFIALNESHHMTKSSGGHGLAAVARRNVGKSPRELQARLCEFTNAHESGGDSVAERTFEAWQKQTSGKHAQLKRDILYDSVESDPGLDFYDPEERAAALAQSYSDAPWSDLERLGDEVMDPRTSAADSIRFYFNGLAAAEDAWVDPQVWDTLSAPGTTVEGDAISMFLDCSKSGDATALMGCRCTDGFNFAIDVWERPRGKRGEGFLVDRDKVDVAVRAAFDTYRVKWFGVDPSPASDDETEAEYWAEKVDEWHRDFGKRLRLWASTQNAVAFDMRMSKPGGRQRNRLFVEQAEIVARQIDEEGLDGPLRHDGNSSLRAHVHNAKKRNSEFGFTLGKVTRDSSKLVDLAVAMVGANLGRRLLLNSGKYRPGKKAKVSF